MKRRLALDTSVLTSIVNSDDVFHQPCYQFFREHHDADIATWVVPGLIMFEYQATQSRRYRELHPNKKVFRNAPLFVDKCELYELSKEFLWKVDELSLYDLFGNLKGADLVYACIAKVEGIPLVTHDKQFLQYRTELELINPCEQ
jgi:predicted nucleic acid-binding protein